MTRDDSLRLSRIGMALLERLPPRPRGHVVVVTSALPGEGKSFVSDQLSTRLTRVLRAPVARIDASGSSDRGDAGGFAGLVRRGRMPTEAASSMPSERGWENSVDSADSVIRLAAGTRVQPALFQLDGVGRALQHLQQRFRLSIVDAPVLTDCGALLWHADAILLVVDSARTDPGVVREAMAEAGIEPERFVGAVLNRAPRQRQPWQAPRMMSFPLRPA